jgi:hypothetical protein
VNADDFRRNGHLLVDWVADYLTEVERHPVSPPVEPGWVRAQLPPRAPTEPESFEAVLADVERVIVPTGSTRPSSPTSPPTRRTPRSSASCSPPVSACKGCCGRPAPPAPSWRPTSPTG